MVSFSQVNCAPATPDVRKSPTMKNESLFFQDLLSKRPASVKQIKIVAAGLGESSARCAVHSGKIAQYKLNKFEDIELSKLENLNKNYIYQIYIQYIDNSFDFLELNDDFNIHGKSDIFLKTTGIEYSIEFPWLVNWKVLLTGFEKCAEE